MDSAKSAVKGFLNKSGHHDTTVHEKVAPAVVQETQHTHHHEDVQTAVDKEVHQDHYHTSVQPVFDKEVKAEQHHHNLAAVEHRNFEHGNDREVQEKLRLEQSKYQDEVIAGETKHTQSVKPTVGGEHIHHHVHETIQPVVQKQTVEPHVTHTVVPIHEVHHNAASHHSASALPAVSMAEFKKAGGVLTGREERQDGFEGEPKSMLAKAENAVTGHHSEGHHHGHHTTGTGSGLTGSSTTGSGLTGNNTTGSGLTGSHHHHNSGLTGNNTTGSGLTGNNTTGSGLTGNNTTGSGLTGSNTTGSGLTGSNTTGTSSLGSSNSRV